MFADPVMSVSETHSHVLFIRADAYNIWNWDETAHAQLQSMHKRRARHPTQTEVRKYDDRLLVRQNSLHLDEVEAHVCLRIDHIKEPGRKVLGLQLICKHNHPIQRMKEMS
jgi:hypothetical protein